MFLKIDEYLTGFKGDNVKKMQYLLKSKTYKTKKFEVIFHPEL